jgi:ribosomal protein S18 acetylase RimI-like enzyme
MHHAPFGVRAATEADCDFLWRLTEVNMCGYVAQIGVWDEAIQEKQFWCTFDPARWRVLVADKREIGGFALDRHPQALFLADLHILPEYQNRGIGSAVIRALIADAREEGVPLLLQVLDSNPRARHLYERLGFSFGFPSPMAHYSVMITNPSKTQLHARASASYY